MNLFQRAINKFNKEVDPALTQQGVIPDFPEFPEFPVSDNQAASTATDVATIKNDFNALLTKLKDAGLMEADPVPPEAPPEEGGGSGDQDPEAT